MKFCHKLSVNPVLDPEGQPSCKEQPVFTQHPLFIAQIEDQQIVAAGIKRYKLLALEIGLEVVKKDGVFPHSIDSYLVEWPRFKRDAIAAAKDLGMLRALQVAVHQQAAVRAYGDPGLTEERGGVDSGCQDDKIGMFGDAAIKDDQSRY